VFPELVVKLAVGLLAALSVGGLAWAVFGGRGEAEKRMAKVAAADRGGARGRGDPRRDADKRRKQIEDALKGIEAKNDRVSKNPPLEVRIDQAGLTWTKRTFYVVSAVSGLVFLLAAKLAGAHLLVALAIGFAAALGFPRWFLSFKRNRRLNKFASEFPNAVDVVVRGVKAGLPLGDCIRIVAQEAEEPVRSEFRQVVETQAMGITLGDAVQRLYERVPTPEVNFFAIVVAVQQTAGGNLSEVLGNLSKVLRDRKKMKAKVKALSQEAKASAMIIAALPFTVMGLVYITSPDYISMLWTTSPGQFMLMLSAVWMTIGVLVMRKMINFDF
jgi:tight adherence protein B